MSILDVATSVQTTASQGTLRVAALGDSKAEGVGADTLTMRWQDVLRDRLREKYTPGEDTSQDRGVGFIPCLYAGWVNQPTPTVTGTQGTDWDSNNAEGSYGMREILLKTSSCIVTFPVTQTRYITVHYTKRWSPWYNGQFTISSNGTQLATIDTKVDDLALDATEGRQTFDLGSVQNTEVTLRWVSGTGPRIAGVTFQTAQAGVTVVDASHAGFMISSYNDSSNPGGTKLNLESLSNFDPHLIILALGSNDMSQTWDPNTTWKNLVVDFISKLKSSCPKAVILFDLGPMRVEDARSATPTDNPQKYGRFKSALENALGGDPRVGIVYEADLFTPINAVPANTVFPREQDPAGFLFDSVHPSNYGNALIARMIFEALTQDVSGVVQLPPYEPRVRKSTVGGVTSFEVGVSKYSVHLPRTIPEANSAFSRVPPYIWRAADGSFSIALPDGRSLWLYGDTMSEANGFVHNSAIVQRGGEFTVCNGGKQFIPNDSDGMFYWTSGGVYVGSGLLLIACTGIAPVQANNRQKACVVSIDDDDNLTFLKWLDWWPTTKGTWSSGPSAPISYVEITLVGDTLYAFGLKDADAFGRQIYPATVPLAECSVPSAWEFGKEPIWAAPEADSGCSSWFDGSLFHVMTKKQGMFSQDILLYTSPNPMKGPWTRRVLTTLRPSLKGQIEYIAHAHPEWKLADGSMVATVGNSWNGGNPSLQDVRPLFFSVKV